jgi:hypothetical protein
VGVTLPFDHPAKLDDALVSLPVSAASVVIVGVAVCEVAEPPVLVVLGWTLEPDLPPPPQARLSDRPRMSAPKGSRFIDPTMGELGRETNGPESLSNLEISP